MNPAFEQMLAASRMLIDCDAVNAETLDAHLHECRAERSNLYHRIGSLEKQLREANETIRRMRVEKWQQRKERKRT